MSVKLAKIIKFSDPVVPVLSTEDLPEYAAELPVLGGLLSDANYCWHARGSCLEVRNLKNGRNMGSWSFGNVLRDFSTKVVCVEEIERQNGRLSMLAVGTQSDICGAMVCVFDVCSSKVLRAVQIQQQQITSLHVVDSGLDRRTFRGRLRVFDGILAVGFAGGTVFLLDLCRTLCEEAEHDLGSSIRDELNPYQIHVLSAYDLGNADKVRRISREFNLALHINMVVNSHTDHFTLKDPENKDRVHVNKEEVTVSCLKYCPQLASLLIGYNFGAFQLWNLTDFELTYTSPICQDHTPITHFACQEPSDDPRYYFYVWVVYSSSEIMQETFPFGVLYSFCYKTKEHLVEYGSFYSDFEHGGSRFQIDMRPHEEHKLSQRPRGGWCMGLETVTKSTYRDVGCDESTGDNLSLCFISWTLWYGNSETQSYLCLFDLNMWYKEQLPPDPKWREPQTQNYLLRIHLNDHLSGRSAERQIITLGANKKSLQQFLGVQRLEEHFYPTALSFDTTILREDDAILLHSESLQGSLLAQIETAGPLCVLKPNDFFHQIINLGLLPLFSDVSTFGEVAIDKQREVLLDVGLEQKLVGWLCKCASEWANGSFASGGCSLEFLLNWAFSRAVILKRHCDCLCTSQFDYSETKLDANTTHILNNCIRQFNNLHSFYLFVIKKLANFLTNLETVLQQHRCLETISLYYEVLQWLINVALLPECHPNSFPRMHDHVVAPYHVDKIIQYVFNKRLELQQLSHNTFASADSLLFIDNLILKCGGEKLQKQWREDGGSGLYPPPSIQSFLRTFLIEDVELRYKHALTIYMFFDLARTLDPITYKSLITNLLKFPVIFKVSQSTIKITQAFWELDHGNFAVALEDLLDPFVLNDELEQWHHAVALRSLLLQNQQKLALLYMQIRKPTITAEKDILTAISLFTANNMLDEAFYFQKHHQNGTDEKLLVHLFNECNKSESIQKLLYRSLSSKEEKTFFKYLQTLHDPSADDLQVFYYLLRSRFVEAFDAHDNSKRKKPEYQGLIGQRAATKADQVVKIFKNLLPDVNRNLINIVRKDRLNLWKEVERPTPFSVFVHNNKEQIHYKSTVLNAALAKAKQTFHGADISICKEVNTEDVPFLRTPSALTPRPKLSTPVITPRIIIDAAEEEEVGPSPCKKAKLETPRRNTSANSSGDSSFLLSQMSTPIVKRLTPKKYSRNFTPEPLTLNTPQSILKGNALGVSSRQPLSRNSSRSFVRFNDSGVSQESTPEKATLDPGTFENNVKTSADSSLSDNVFYSPNTSFDDQPVIVENRGGREVTPEVLDGKMKDSKMEIEDNSNALRSSLPSSPRGRKSYKRSLGESPEIQSSPRRSTRLSTENNFGNSSPSKVLESPTKPRGPGKKSLSRQVLENVTFRKVSIQVERHSLLEQSIREKPGNEEVFETASSEVVESEKDERLDVPVTTPRLSLFRTVTADSSMNSDFSDIMFNSSCPEPPDFVTNFIKNKDLDDTMNEPAAVQLGEEIVSEEEIYQEPEADVIIEKPEVKSQEVEQVISEEPEKVIIHEVEQVISQEPEESVCLEEKQEDLCQESEFVCQEHAQEIYFILEEKPVEQKDNVTYVEDESSSKETSNEIKSKESLDESSTSSSDSSKSLKPTQQKSELPALPDFIQQHIRNPTQESSSEESAPGYIPEPMDIYDDLSSAGSDIRENGQHCDVYPAPNDFFGDVYGDLSNHSYSNSNELPAPPELETNFIGENECSDSETRQSFKPSDDVIEIGSSSEEQKSETSEDGQSQSSQSNQSDVYNASTDHDERREDIFELDTKVDNDEDSTVSSMDSRKTLTEPIAITEIVDVNLEEDSASGADLTNEFELPLIEEPEELKEDVFPKEDIVIEELPLSNQSNEGSDEVSTSKKNQLEEKLCEAVSSSDSNDIAKEEVVVTVEVHEFPIKAKEPPPSPVLTPSRRITRRLSQLEKKENTDEIQVVESNKTPQVEEKAKALPTKRQTRSASVDQINTRRKSTNRMDSPTIFSGDFGPTPLVPRKTRSQIDEAEVQSNESNENVLFEEPIFIATPAIRKTRSASVEERKIYARKLSTIEDSETADKPPTPRVRKTRSVSSDERKTYSRKTISKKTLEAEENVKLFDESVVFPTTPALRKTRSVSADQVKQYHRRDSKLEDVLDEKNIFDENAPKTPVIRRAKITKTYEKRASSEPKDLNVTGTVKVLPAISEEETYTASRRLTRRQASMLKEINQTSKLEPIDPINLLDKPDFQGTPDPDEQNIYDSSPSTSSVTSSQQPAKRASRSASVASNSSAQGTSLVSTPTRRSARLSSGVMENPMPSPTKKPRKRAGSTDEVPVARTTRARSVSESSEKSSTSVTRKTKPKKLSELPEIAEEEKEEKVVKKPGRKRKTESK